MACVQQTACLTQAWDISTLHAAALELSVSFRGHSPRGSGSWWVGRSRCLLVCLLMPEVEKALTFWGRDRGCRLGVQLCSKRHVHERLRRRGGSEDFWQGSFCLWGLLLFPFSELRRRHEDGHGGVDIILLGVPRLTAGLKLGPVHPCGERVWVCSGE